jgi:uncharacterized protein YgbK (DUF1537 family)
MSCQHQSGSAIRSDSTATARAGEPLIVSIADDQTGANATAALLRDAGLAPVALTRWDAPFARRPLGSVLVVNADTRDIDGVGAGTRVASLVREIATEQKGRLLLWNKRIDSTLRGNIVPELAAMRGELPVAPLLLAPAFPTAGRVTVGGRQLLENGPAGERRELGELAPLLHQLGVEGIERVNAENVVKIMAGVESEALAGGAVLADAVTDADLAAVARAALRLWLTGAVAVDSGPFVGHLARAALASGLLETVADGPVVLVLGTRSPITERQLALLRTVHPGHVLIDPPTDGEIERADVVALTSPGTAESAEAALRALTLRAAEVLARLPRPHALIVSGGLTCGHLLAQLRAESLEVRGEMLPLVPFGILRGGAADGAYLATKGGLAGQEEALLQAVRLIALLRRKS